MNGTEINQDQKITLSEAARLLSEIEGVSFSPQRLWGWHKNGVKGIHLRTEPAPGNRFTTLRWLREFRNAVVPKMSNSSPSRKQLDEEDRAAVERLRRKGIKIEEVD